MSVGQSIGDVPPKVLIIDDEELVHRLIARFLQKQNIQVIGAHSSKDGIELARAERPDVILLDQDLGDDSMTGLDVLHDLLSREETGRAAMIFLTSIKDQDLRLKALAMGAVDYIFKDAHETELVARVRNLCKLQSYTRLLEQRLMQDLRTALYNRNYFDNRLRAEIQEAHRHERSLSVMMVDIDRFKSINDTHNHLFGDKVIEVVAKTLASGRGSDIPCRFGGDEFAIILPSTGQEAAVEVAQRHLNRIRQHVWDEHPELMVTASAGVASLDFGEDCGSPNDERMTLQYRSVDSLAESFLRLADEALIRAKGGVAGGPGRDRVMVAVRCLVKATERVP